MRDKKINNFNNNQINQRCADYINEGMNISNEKEIKKQRKKILLHSCCGPCSTSVIERLIYDYDITVLFYNPNITDEEEYKKREETQGTFIDKFNLNPDRISKIEYKGYGYDPKPFLEGVAGLENEPEGGSRCNICFRIRLEKTAHEAMLGGYDYFTTTLSVSPHKNHEVISKLGNDLSMRCSLSFLPIDFKKKNGYARSIELSKKYGLYRQNYCGCDFSK